MSFWADLELRLLILRETIRSRLPHLAARARRAGVYHLPNLAAAAGPPPAGIAMVAIVKDEAPYLAEWLEFHFMLGVRHIYIYDNGGTDDTPLILAPYIRAGIVTVVPWRNFSKTLGPQPLAYNHALANFGPSFAWMALIDVDEFLFPAEGASLDDTMRKLAHLPGVSLPWICFGPSGHRTKPDGLVIENYTERALFPHVAEQYTLLKHKAIVNPREITAGGWPHHFHSRAHGPGLINDRGVAFPTYKARVLANATADHLRLNHYFTRSHDEMEKKLAKGRVSRSGGVNMKALERRFAQYSLHTEKDTEICRFLPELKRRLALRFEQTHEPAAALGGSAGQAA